jgi:CRISPR/Cas system CMR subunit Cmr6 (Cas7 group RAMP superfamily)
VAFITRRLKAQFVIALTRRDQWDPRTMRAWLGFTRKQLLVALEQWGIGGNTAAGYGRMKPA